MNDKKSRRVAQRIIGKKKVVGPDLSIEKITPELNKLTGTILEIGPGDGKLLSSLPKNIVYTGLEPNLYLHEALQTAITERGGSLGQIVSGSAEQIPFPDEAFDAVISVRTLCSMSNLQTALREIKRVLKVGGVFIFVEHVGAPRWSVRRILQELARPLWRYLTACNPAADIQPAIEGAGFRKVTCTPFRVGGRRNVIVRLRIFGVAVK